MVKLNVIKGYYDIKLGRKIEVGEILEVDNKRALELLQNKTKVVDVLEISKLSSKKNEAIVSSKKGNKLIVKIYGIEYELIFPKEEEEKTKRIKKLK